MKEYIRLIEKSPLLNCLPKEQVHTCLKEGSFRISTYGKHHIIHFSGEVCRELEIILTGQVNVERIDEAGNLTTIAEFYGGEILGGNLLFSKNPYYPMTITAKQPTTMVAIGKEHLLELASGNPAFFKELSGICGRPHHNPWGAPQTLCQQNHSGMYFALFGA